MNNGDSYQPSLYEEKEEELIAGSDGQQVSSMDVLVGFLEDIMIGDKFQQAHESFIEKHCMVFEESEENKLCYTQIHQDYVRMLEDLLEEELKRRVPGFRMTDLLDQLRGNPEDLEGEVFEMLYTLTDFVSFKEMMLDHKKDCQMTKKPPDLSWICCHALVGRWYS